jgi:glyoxylase-like metal-dependent hydrolase (beta-lactamase superfamily II)
MTAPVRFVTACALLLLAVPRDGSDRAAPVRTQIASGVYLFQTAPYGDVGLDGNAVAIVTPDGVLVFDTNGTPAAAAAVLREIRSLTDRPVRFIVNSHWHWDHWYGTEVYRRAFPDVRIIAHEKTRAMMMGPALDFNRPGLERDLPGYVHDLERQASEAAPASAERSALEHRAADARFFLDQKTSVHHTFPDMTFVDRLTLHLGQREIQILNRGRAVTPGDAFLYLPDEKILITGDLLVNPISFALSCYPTEWLRTLDYLDSLDARVIVPGHGAPLHDERLLHATMTVFKELLHQGAALKASGVPVDDARDRILPSLKGPMDTITNGDAALAGPFRIQVVDWYLHRVYEELDGPLSDAIGPIPRS